MFTVQSRETVSRRAKPPPPTGKGTASSLERKDVFKSVLDNPFHIQWPSVPTDTQNEIISRLASLFNGVSDYHLSREDTHRRKRKAAKQQSTTRAQKKQKSTRIEDDTMSFDLSPSQSAATVQVIPMDDIAPSSEVSTHTALHLPPALQHLTIGINEVTKRLESHVRSLRQTLSTPRGASSPAQAIPRPPIKAIFVCRADVNPPTLVAHLPQLVAACNSMRSDPDGGSALVTLIPFPRGAEATLAATIGLRRVAVLAIDAGIPGLSSIADLLDGIPVPRAAWLTPRFFTLSDHMEPTHIKQLRTSAPKDMKAAKELRNVSRAIAKEKRRRKKAGDVPLS
ncbi:hypothetical protein OF83DRAFT_1112942 [Amylostereum chailletii]|nr:hypothetical protein OF83DRAFT_1112942 [Amylostereum chailletii]